MRPALLLAIATTVAAQSQPWTESRDSWLATPLTERHSLRRASEDEYFDRARRHGRGAYVRESRQFLVVSTVDRRFTNKVVAAAETFWVWCEKNWGWIGDDYVRRCVLQITQAVPNEIQRAPGATATRGAVLAPDRLVSVKKDDANGSSIGGIGAMYNRIFDLYVQDKDPLLFQYMPRWLSAGLAECIAATRVKGRHVILEPDDDEREDVRAARRHGGLIELRRFMRLSDAEYRKLALDDGNIDDQAASVVRFLLVGPGSKHRTTKAFLENYARNIVHIANEHRRRWDDERDLAAIVAEEQAERRTAPPDQQGSTPDPAAEAERLRRVLWERRRQAISVELATEAFHWDEAEWKRVRRAYLDFVEDY